MFNGGLGFYGSSSFRVGNELLAADDKTLFSRPFLALTQALSAVPAQTDAKAAKKKKGKHGDADRLFLTYSVPSAVKASVRSPVSGLRPLALLRNAHGEEAGINPRTSELSSERRVSTLRKD
jgi:hypothetical protein